MKNIRLNELKKLLNDPKLKPLIDVATFMLITVVFHYLWWGGLVQWLSGMEWFNAFRDFMTWLVFTQAAWFNTHILGLEFNTTATTLIFPGSGYVEVAESCAGTKQFYQIIVLFLLIRGPWKHKVWYIPAALLLMHLVNVVRIIVLSWVVIHYTKQWDFIHEWILRPFFYVVIFAEWYLWIEFFAVRTTKIPNEVST